MCKRGWFGLLCEIQEEGEREAGDLEMAETMVSGVRLTEKRLRLQCDIEAVQRAEGCAVLTAPDSVLGEIL